MNIATKWLLRVSIKAIRCIAEPSAIGANIICMVVELILVRGWEAPLPSKGKT